MDKILAFWYIPAIITFLVELLGLLVSNFVRKPTDFSHEVNLQLDVNRDARAKALKRFLERKTLDEDEAVDTLETTTHLFEELDRLNSKRGKLLKFKRTYTFMSNSLLGLFIGSMIFGISGVLLSSVVPASRIYLLIIGIILTLLGLTVIVILRSLCVKIEKEGVAK